MTIIIETLFSIAQSVCIVILFIYLFICYQFKSHVNNQKNMMYKVKLYEGEIWMLRSSEYTTCLELYWMEDKQYDMTLKAEIFFVP